MNKTAKNTCFHGAPICVCVCFGGRDNNNKKVNKHNITLLDGDKCYREKRGRLREQRALGGKSIEILNE